MASDILLPPWLKISRLQTSYLDNTGMTRGLYTAAPETTGFGGDRLKLSLEFVPTSSKQTPVERAAIRSFLARLRGRQNRAYLHDPSYRGPRGAFSALAFELLSNNTFANGTTGWSANSRSSISVADRVLRSTRNGVAGIAGWGASSAVTVTPYAPYALRAFFGNTRGTQDSFGLLAGTAVGNSDYLSQIFTGAGLHTAAFVPHVSSLVPSFYDLETSGTLAGDYTDYAYVSLSPCALVDNSPNGFLQSDTFSDAVWVKNAGSVSGNVRPSPDGASTADDFDENGASAEHYVEQAYVVPSAAADFCGVIDLKATGRTFALLNLIENTGATGAQIYVNMTDGSRSNPSVGANWANIRTFTVDRGDGWFRFYIVARKTNAATTIRLRVSSVASIGGTTVITGLGASAFSMWRGGIAQSSVPFEPGQTTSAASAGTSQAGGALRIKGLPASTNGLLLPDDRSEVVTSRGSEMKIGTSALNSDAAGLGYQQSEPPLRGIPADNAPVIVGNPMTRAIFAGDMVGWDDSPGILTTASAEFEEA